MSRGFENYLRAQRERCTTHLASLAVANLQDPGSHGPLLQEFAEGLQYALNGAGKLVRPTLVYAAADAIDPDTNCGLALDYAACAVELIHAYSLAHDDLPAMDDDDLRRGKPSLHRAYNEAMAILVGDGLQARAFELLADSPGLGAVQKVRAVKALAQAAGPAGMVGGQFIDIQATDSDLNLSELQAMHSLKTGALIRASLALGAITAGGTEQQVARLDEYGVHIGLAFQVVDDILDVQGDAQTLGKTSGKDTVANKPTYVKLLGLEGAKEEAQRLLQAALVSLEGFGQSAQNLRDLAHYIVERDH